MLDKNRVYHLFLVFADLENQESSRLRPLCDATADSLEAKLRKNIDTGRYMKRLCICAAALAYCSYCELSSTASDGEEIRVGEISLRSSAAASSSPEDYDALRKQFLSDIADLLRPPFVFGQVGL